MSARSARGLALALTLVAAVPLRAPIPTGHGDNHWLLVINLARVSGLQFGDDLVFTYGPFGYLAGPQPVDRWGVLVAGVFCACSLAAFWWLAQYWLVNTLGLFVGLLAASLLTILLNAFSTPSWILVAAIAGWVLTSLTTRVPPSTCQIAALVGASTLLLMVKFSEGVTAIALTAGLVIATGSLKANILAGVGGVLSIIGWWLLAGQRLTDFGTWLRSSVEIAAGYPGAMGLEPWGKAPLWLALLVVILAAVGMLLNDRGGLDRAGVFRWLVLLGLTWLAVKQSFVRSDTLHHTQFYVMMSAVLLVGIRWLPRCQVQLTALLLTVLMIPPLAYKWPSVTDDVSWEDSLRTLISPSFLKSRLDEQKFVLGPGFAIPPTMLDRLGDDPVVVEPLTATAGWVANLNMKPLPTIEPYSAYTEYLDVLNRNAVLENPATRVLRTTGAIDRRFQLWDSPRYHMALVCRFQQVESDGRWTLLEQRANRCHGQRVLEERTVRAGESVDLPAVGPNEILTARYKPDDPDWFGQLRGLLLAPQPLYVQLGETSFRLPPAHTSGPLILSLPPAVAWPAEGAGRPSGETFVLPRDGSVAFEAVRVRASLSARLLTAQRAGSSGPRSR